MEVSRLALMQYGNAGGSPVEGPKAESGRQRRDSSPAQLAFSHQLPVSTQVRQTPVYNVSATKQIETVRSVCVLCPGRQAPVSTSCKLDGELRHNLPVWSSLVVHYA